MAKKKAKKTTATRSRATSSGTGSTRRRKRKEPESPLFPVRMILEFEDGTEEELPFADPTESARGNLNAWAGNKFVRNGKMLRINCNVTQVRG